MPPFNQILLHQPNLVSNVYINCNSLNGKDTLNSKIKSTSSHRLWGAVATVNNQVRAGGVGGRVRGQVQVSTLQLVSLALATHGDLVPPDVLGLLRHKVGNFRSNITGRDSVGAGEPDPFNGQGLACVIISYNIIDNNLSENIQR